MKSLEQLTCRMIGIGVIALGAMTCLALSSTPAAAENNDAAIRPFRVNVPNADLADLKRRLAATRWPTKELVDDRSQGVQLATLKALVRYWATDYDWRKAEAKLNAFPQFVTKIDGVDIHFIHVKSRHPNALPVIITHGWPGSVFELLEVIDPLTNPTAHGGSAEDAFHVVIPSLPGYGFSGEPAELGWESGRIARAWAELMERLGYTRYVAQGGDVGASVTDAMARQAPKGLVGIHLNLLAGALGIVDKLPAKSEEERAALNALASFRMSGFGYFLEQSTRPQTIGYSLQNSPVGLAAWLLDHDTDSYYKISRAFVGGEPVGSLTRDTIVDNITLVLADGHRHLGRPVVLGVRTVCGRGRCSGRLLRRSRFPSASPRSPARSGLPRAAGLRRSTPASPTSTRSTRAATSPRGRSRRSSPPKCVRHSDHFGNGAVQPIEQITLTDDRSQAEEHASCRLNGKSLVGEAHDDPGPQTEDSIERGFRGPEAVDEQLGRSALDQHVDGCPHSGSRHRCTVEPQFADARAESETLREGTSENDVVGIGGRGHRRERPGSAGGAGAARRNPAHRSPAARSQHPRTRGHPDDRRNRSWCDVVQAHASG